MAKAASKSKAAEKKPASKKSAAKSGTTTRSRKPKKQDPVAEQPAVIEQAPVETVPVEKPIDTMPVAEHEAIVEQKNNLLRDALEHIKATEQELEFKKKQLNKYLQPIDSDVQHTKQKVSAMPVFFKWVLGIIALGLLLFAGYRAYKNSSDETAHQATQEEVKALEKQRDSLVQDGQFYKRVAEEQAKQTAYYKKKVQEVTGEIQLDNTTSDKEREADKKKINETKNAIRRAASDRELIDVLTNTLRQ